LQVKLLRFLQERVIERIGGRQPIAVDTRIVCATHQDLEAMIADGRFREDLYYRLAEIVVKIPALAERSGDAVLLARHFVNLFSRELNPAVQSLSPDALDAIDAYGWPGNVRELENRIKRAVIMADGKCVTSADLDLPSPGGTPDDAMPINLRAAREVADRKAIRQAMSRTDNNISGAAKLLGISRPTLYDLLKHYRLQA
jgi:two-component system NtrC family response regulator